MVKNKFVDTHINIFTSFLKKSNRNFKNLEFIIFIIFFKFIWIQEMNTGRPKVAVVIKAPAKIIKGR
tara:strand:+ start:843 stop:1043 length:201 start_codon:yes stop_codon:yes gene_type:complete